MTSAEIISNLPYSEPFLFVNEILEVNDEGVTGTYTYKEDAFFYKGHFKGNPITPGVILTETMAQIGLVVLGIYIMEQNGSSLENIKIALSSTEIDFFKVVLPGEKVIVKSTKEYFRFNKLKCKIEMYNEAEALVCRGNIAGMIKI